MENLTRNNYEIWFLDYLDGQLNNEQLEMLLDFLESNPDLKEELQGVSGATLHAGTESFENKALLNKSIGDIPGIGAIDQLCIARMENDLPEDEAIAFDLQLKKDPALGENFAAFQATRLNPAIEVVFPEKKNLYKKTRTLAPWIITAVSSAAVILLAWFLWPETSEKVSPPIAKIEQPVKNTPQPAITNQSQVVASQNPGFNKIKADKVVPKAKKPDSINIYQRETTPIEMLSHKSVVAGPRIPDPQRTRILFASSFIPALINRTPEEDAMTVPQYAMQIFREKILGEDRSIVRKTRFSIWEVAGAGVNKINSLAGTDMKLNREYDTKGDILAVSFNSKLFDVEAPIRGQENR
jgi:hypothetical protein